MLSIGIFYIIGNVVFGFLGDCNRVNCFILYIVFLMWFVGFCFVLVLLFRNLLLFVVFDGIYGWFFYGIF